MKSYRYMYFMLAVMLCLLAAGCQFLKPSPDAVALAKVKEALTGNPGWQVEDLTITVTNLHCKVAGEVGSATIAENLNVELKKLVEQGVIKSFANNCTIMDATNPLMQDFTAPSLAF